MENQLLNKMNELINEGGTPMTENDLPELVASDFNAIDLKTKLRFINKKNDPGNNAE